MTGLLRRRNAIGLLAGLPVLPHLSGAAPADGGLESFHAGATVLVAGPADGQLDRVSRAIVPVLARTLPPGTAVDRTLSGGPDGVTGANQFDARSAPDGLTLLMVPGAAALAWLSGDPRAQFDAGKWVPVMAATTPTVVAGRSFNRHQRVRIAASTPNGPELTALLAFDLLGIPFIPIFGLGDAATARQAFAQGAVDIVLAHGPNALEQLGTLAAFHAHPIFAVGVPCAEGTVARDPLVPGVPDLAEYAAAVHGTRLQGSLYQAWRGTAAATRLEYGLVLPQLTPPEMVSAWRLAGAQTAAAPDIRAGSGSVTTLAAPDATPCLAEIVADAGAQIDLRRWLAERLSWKPQAL